MPAFAMDLLKATPELFAEYINFLILYSRGPSGVVERYTPDGATSERQVSAKLLVFALLGVGAGLLIATVGDALGMAEDQSQVLTVMRRVDERLLPVAVLLVIAVAAVVLHLLARLATAVARVVYREQWSTGSLPDSLNASMAFASWYVPAVTTVMVAVRMVAAHATVNPLIFIPISVLCGLAFFVYLAAAFAGAHRIPFQRAMVLLGLAFGVCTFLAGVVL